MAPYPWTFEAIIQALAEQHGWSYSWTADWFYNQLTTEQRLEALSNAGFYYTTNGYGGMTGWVRSEEAIATVTQEIGSGAITTAETAGSGAVATEFVEETVSGTTKVAVKPLAETTTTAGNTIKSGGVVTGVNVAIGALLALEVAGAVAKDWKTHNDWWNDLSDSVFQQGEFTGIHLDSIGDNGDYDWWLTPGYAATDWGQDVMRVIQRRVDDALGLSHYYTYMDATDIALLEMQLAIEGAFNPNDVEFPVEEPNPSIALHGNREDIINYCKTMNARFNSEYGAWTETAISGTTIQQACIGALNRAPLDADCVSISINGAAHNGQSVTIRIFKGTDNGRVSETSSQYSTDYNAYGFSGGFGMAMITKRPEQTESIEYYSGTMSTSDAISYGYFTGNTTSVNKGILSSNINATYNEGGLPEEGIEIPADSQLLDIAGLATVLEVLNALREQFPEWWGEGFDMNVFNPEDNTISPRHWLPVSIPSYNPKDANYQFPEGFTQGYGQTGKPYPDPNDTSTPYPYPKDVPWYIPYSKPVQVYTTGGDTATPYPTPDSPPTVPVVSGSSNALWAVYNPTFSEVSSLGSYLWSSSIIDIIQKFFSNPMDAIISLHMIYTEPIRGGRQNIKLGYLDSNVSSLTVANQYKFIDCGEVIVPNYFLDVRDYSPYTKIDIFLPFIGIRSLAPEDVIGCRVNVKYKVDVLTGAILCEIFVTKRGVTQCLYTFAGNASVQIPLTGGDRTRLLSGVISGVASVAGGAMIGGVGGAVVAGVHGVTGLHQSSQVERAGNFSANAGAMGIKTPYIIVNRKDAYDAYNYNTQHGYPINETVQLGSCKGYTKVRDIHLNNVPATQNEKIEIERLLKEGFVIK